MIGSNKNYKVNSFMTLKFEKVRAKSMASLESRGVGRVAAPTPLHAREVLRTRDAISNHLGNFGRGMERMSHALLQAVAANDIELRQSLRMRETLKLANTILTKELVDAKEQLAQYKAENDVLTDELKLCGALSTAVSMDDRHAHGQELAALRARAALQKARIRADMASDLPSLKPALTQLTPKHRTLPGQDRIVDGGVVEERGGKRGGARWNPSESCVGKTEEGEQDGDAHATRFFISCMEDLVLGNTTADGEFQSMLSLLQVRWTAKSLYACGATSPCMPPHPSLPAFLTAPPHPCHQFDLFHCTTFILLLLLRPITRAAPVVRLAGAWAHTTFKHSTLTHRLARGA